MQESELIKRVKKCRDELKELGLPSPRYFFALKYKEYNNENRLNNLYYGKIADADFTVKLEAFTRYKITEYNE